MLISIGEILVDVFVDGEKKNAFPGGAPFNLAANIAHFGGDVSFYGVVGKDDDGAFLRNFALEKVPGSIIESLDDRHTSEAIVALENGERTFRFNRNNGADYALSIKTFARLNLEKANIIHIGSLMLSYEEGQSFFYEAIQYAKAHSSALISFDVNYRDDIFPSPEIARKTFLKAIKYADIVKFTEEELRLLSGKEDLDEAIGRLLKPNQIAFVTLGKDGSLFYQGDKKIHAETKPLKPFDTTGAGDAFYSYILYALDNDLDLHDDKAIKLALEKANYVGGQATQKKGAIGVVPSVDEIELQFK